MGRKTTVKSEDAWMMSFPDAAFDVVLSNLCLHNIYERPGRAQVACREIARVLKPGAAVVSDYKHAREYADELRRVGLEVRLDNPDWTGTFPPPRILVARKQNEDRHLPEIQNRGLIFRARTSCPAS